MTRLSDSMFDDATRRNDLFQQLVTTGGFGGAAWLVRDKMTPSLPFTRENRWRGFVIEWTTKTWCDHCG